MIKELQLGLRKIGHCDDKSLKEQALRKVTRILEQQHSNEYDVLVHDLIVFLNGIAIQLPDVKIPIYRAPGKVSDQREAVVVLLNQVREELKGTTSENKDDHE